MDFSIEEGFTSHIDQIQSLFLELGGFNNQVFEHALNHRPSLVNCYAFEQHKLVGIKIGFSPRPQYFESWAGGVLPAYRRQGVASKLLQLQHGWCLEKGFRYIDTTTANDNIPMQLVNLKNGMQIVGTFLDRGNELKVRFQKQLPKEDNSTSHRVTNR